MLFRVKSVAIILALHAAAFAWPTQANDNVTDAEIAHLLAFVATSGCEFERNRTLHSPAEASEHMQMKYQHVKRRVHNAEGFIRYAASESSFSGRPYHAICSGTRITSGEWLTGELAHYRDQQKMAADAKQ